MWSDTRYPDRAYVDAYSPLAASDQADLWRSLCRVRPSLLSTLRTDALAAYLAVGTGAPVRLAALLAQLDADPPEDAAGDANDARALLSASMKPLAGLLWLVMGRGR
jgi:hypothetical protein